MRTGCVLCLALASGPVRLSNNFQFPKNDCRVQSLPITVARHSTQCDEIVRTTTRTATLAHSQASLFLLWLALCLFVFLSILPFSPARGARVFNRFIPRYCAAKLRAPWHHAFCRHFVMFYIELLLKWAMSERKSEAERGKAKWQKAKRLKTWEAAPVKAPRPVMCVMCAVSRSTSNDGSLKS